MKHEKLKLSAVLLLSFGFAGLKAQAVNPATGGDASGTGGKASYSVGQVVYTTNLGTTGSVIQGVQQPYEISVVTAIGEAKDIKILVSVFPNPLNDILHLKIENTEIEKLSYQLFNLNGEMLITERLATSETQINMKEYVAGTYFLKITDRNKILESFKIIKN